MKAGECEVEQRGSAQQLTIGVRASDQHGHQPLYAVIVRRAKAAGLAGATVLRSCEGYLHPGPARVTRLFGRSGPYGDLPVLILIVDERERIAAFLPQLDELIGDGLAVLDDIEAIAHRAGDHDSGPGGSA